MNKVSLIKTERTYNLTQLIRNDLRALANIFAGI